MSSCTTRCDATRASIALIAASRSVPDPASGAAAAVTVLAVPPRWVHSRHPARLPAAAEGATTQRAVLNKVRLQVFNGTSWKLM